MAAKSAGPPGQRPEWRVGIRAILNPRSFVKITRSFNGSRKKTMMPIPAVSGNVSFAQSLQVCRIAMEKPAR